MATTILTNLFLTAYCSCQVCCSSKATHLTSINKPPIQGVTIAAPRWIPLNSTIFIDGKKFIAQDHYNKHLSDRIDIYFTNHLEAKQFGKQIGHKITIIPYAK